MQYQEAVAEARRLVKRSEEDQWRLAQLTYEQVEGGTSHRQWARDIGVAHSTVGYWREMWKRWGSGRLGDRPSFPEAYNIIRERGTAVTGVSQYDANARTAVRNLPPEQKAEVVREALDDQDVAVRVLRDPHTRRNVTDAREQVVHEIEGAARDRTEADPTSRAIREATLELNIESNISKARFWLAESARQVQELEDRDPAVMSRLGVAADEAGVALGWLQTAIEGGQVSDEDLARLLDEGGA